MDPSHLTPLTKESECQTVQISLDKVEHNKRRDVIVNQHFYVTNILFANEESATPTT